MIRQPIWGVWGLFVGLVLMTGLFSCTSATHTTGHKDTNVSGTTADTQSALVAGQDAEQAGIARQMAAMAKAVDKAKASGGSSVDVYLDEFSGVVQSGDLVTVKCTGDFDGTPVPVAPDTALDVVAGGRSNIPGLSRAVLGMTLNEQQLKTVPPEQAFGKYDQSRIRAYPLVRTMPVTLSMPTATYKQNYKILPVKGQLVQITPYFKSRVLEVNDQGITFENLAQDGFSDQSDLGTTHISVDKDKITIRLEPNIGALFETRKEKGRVVKTSNNRFWVDFNHPLAGKTLHLDITVKEITKASALKGMAIDWIEDYDFGLHVAKKRKKDMVLLLYADWCSWCKKMLTRTFEDPLIKRFEKDFVWVKVNSDEQQQIKQRFHQDGFPLTVLLDDNGNVIKQISGFKDAQHLSFELKQLMDTTPLSKAGN